MNTRDARRLSVLLLVLFVAILITMYPLLQFWQQKLVPARERPVALFRSWSEVQLLSFTFLSAEDPSLVYDELQESTMRLAHSLNQTLNDNEVRMLLRLSPRGGELLEKPGRLWNALERDLFPQFRMLAARDGDGAGAEIDVLRRRTVRRYAPFGESLAALAEEISRQHTGELEAFRRIFALLLVMAVAVVAGIFLTLRMLFGFERLQLGVLFHHPDPLFILGPDRLIRYANPAGELTARGAYQRKRIDDVVSLSEEGAPLKNQKMLRTGESVRPVVRHVDRIYSGRGKFLGEVHIFRDMTAWNRLAAEVRKKRELDLLAMMAASFAHEFNNSLASLSGIIELGLIAESELERSNYLAQAKKSIRQASIMTRELIAFGMGDGEGEDVTVGDEIGTALQIVFDGTPGTYRVDLSSIDPSLKSRDKLALQVVLSQVLRNAAEAQVQAGNPELPVELIAVPGDNTGETISILVHDRGQGLPDIDTERLFEPFYSEKWNHKGLGLSFSRHLMERMGGSVDIYPRPGGGTSVMIRLPVYRA